MVWHICSNSCRTIVMVMVQWVSGIVVSSSDGRKSETPAQTTDPTSIKSNLERIPCETGMSMRTVVVAMSTTSALVQESEASQ